MQYRLTESLALGAYRIAQKFDLLSRGVGRDIFVGSYLAYKRLYEARDFQALRPFVRPGTWVLDVGANVGFFTLHFARWLGGAGRVLAIEPEAANVATLERRVTRSGLSPRVEVVRGAADAVTATRFLVVNPIHPGDHRLGAKGVPVQAYAVDDLLGQRGDPNVSLIKIDTEGAEMRTVQGAVRTLRRCRPTLYVEIEDAALREAGSSSDELCETLRSLDYTMYEYVGSAWQQTTNRDAAARRQQRGYMNYLFHVGPLDQSSRAAPLGG